MSRSVLKQCGKCHFVTNDCSSSFYRDDCPRCGSYNFEIEPEKSYQDRKMKEYQDERDYNDRHFDHTSGDSM